MHDDLFSEESINEMILKYSDERMGIRDVVKFEMLLKVRPEYSMIARINRNIRLKLKSLPKYTVSHGFEQRLAERLERETHS